MISIRLPRAVLLDLDDTILEDTGNVNNCWREACFRHCSASSGIDPAVAIRAIEETGHWFWSDPERHRIGRLGLFAARLQIVKMSLLKLQIDNPDLATKIAETYHFEREQGVRPFPDAMDTLANVAEPPNRTIQKLSELRGLSHEGQHSSDR